VEPFRGQINDSDSLMHARIQHGCFFEEIRNRRSLEMRETGLRLGQPRHEGRAPLNRGLHSNPGDGPNRDNGHKVWPSQDGITAGRVRTSSTAEHVLDLNVSPPEIFSRRRPIFAHARLITKAEQTPSVFASITTDRQAATAQQLDGGSLHDWCARAAVLRAGPNSVLLESCWATHLMRLYQRMHSVVTPVCGHL